VTGELAERRPSSGATAWFSVSAGAASGRPQAKSTRLSDKNGTMGNVGTTVNIYFRPMKSSDYRDSKGQDARPLAKYVAF
jgi:hypothetical protein